jgi:hypothetical protein
MPLVLFVWNAALQSFVEGLHKSYGILGKDAGYL